MYNYQIKQITIKCNTEQCIHYLILKYLICACGTNGRFEPYIIIPPNGHKLTWNQKLAMERTPQNIKMKWRHSCEGSHMISNTIRVFHVRMWCVELFYPRRQFVPPMVEYLYTLHRHMKWMWIVSLTVKLTCVRVNVHAIEW